MRLSCQSTEKSKQDKLGDYKIQSHGKGHPEKISCGQDSGTLVFGNISLHNPTLPGSYGDFMGFLRNIF
jgi:hypothetical protein